MTILEAIKQANTAAEIPNFSFANLQSFNSFHVDSFNYEDWPRNVVAPFTIQGTFDGGPHTSETLIIEGFIVRRINQDTNDWRHESVEPDFIEPMRVMARKFIRKLLDSDIVDPQRNAAGYTIQAEYMLLNSHLFGVGYRAQIPIMKNVC
jgi:hypothetical protein